MTTTIEQPLLKTNTSEQDNEAGNSLLREAVEKAMQNYFSSLDGQPVTGTYQMVMAEVEAPLLESVMRYTKGNQSKAAIVLGINRGTLRNKLKIYGVE